ncbi:MAG TPA: hypothetical protein VIZ58_02940 [Thermoanaerobaculia bacterium]
MTNLVCALLVALAQGHGEAGKDKNGDQPTTSDRSAATQPDPGVNAKDSAASNVSDKAETLPQTHPTDLQGGAPKDARTKKKAARTKKTARPLPDAYTPPSPEHTGEGVEPKTGQGKPPPGREPSMPDDTKR